MFEKVDTLPYKTFQKLKTKFPVKTIVLREKDFSMAGVHLLFTNHRDYVEHRFRQEGVKVTRHAHEYRTLSTREPKIGLVYLANDSIVDPAIEVHALIGHNANYTNDAEVAAAKAKL